MTDPSVYQAKVGLYRTQVGGADSLANELGMTDAEKKEAAITLLNMQGEQIQPDEDTLEEESYTTEEVIELCRESLDFLAALAMPTIFEFVFPDMFQAMWQMLRENIDKDRSFPQIALGIPRGFAKTTFIKIFVLWCILFSKKKFILIIGNTEQNAVNVMKDIFDFLDEPNVKKVFGDWRQGVETDSKMLKVFGFRGRNIATAAIGAEGSLRGINIKNARPDLMIFEDIQTRECADSIVQSSALERWMVGTAMKAKSPRGCMFLFVANMYPTPYSILKKLKKNKTWTKLISGAILADGTSLWEELRPLDGLISELENDIEMQHPEIFFSEVMNDTEAGMNQNVDFSKFLAWPWTADDLPQGKFIVIDPSQGKGQDRDAVGLFEVYDGIPGLRSIICEHLSPGNLIKKALALALSENCRFIAVEATAYQATLLYWFNEVCKSVGISGIICMPIHANQTSKNSRIAGGIKALSAGQIILHGSVRAIVQRQIADWNPIKRDNVDDMLDVIAYASKVLSDYQFQVGTSFSSEIIEASGARVEEDNHAF